jgi:hypothetical protein
MHGAGADRADAPNSRRNAFREFLDGAAHRRGGQGRPIQRNQDLAEQYAFGRGRHLLWLV